LRDVKKEVESQKKTIEQQGERIQALELVFFSITYKVLIKFYQINLNRKFQTNKKN